GDPILTPKTGAKAPATSFVSRHRLLWRPIRQEEPLQRPSELTGLARALWSLLRAVLIRTHVAGLRPPPGLHYNPGQPDLSIDKAPSRPKPSKCLPPAARWTDPPSVVPIDGMKGCMARISTPRCRRSTRLPPSLSKP